MSGVELSAQRLTRSALDVERLPRRSLAKEGWALDVSEFNEFQHRQVSLDRRARFDSEPGFKCADHGACGGDSTTENLCKCGVRILEGGTEFARRIVPIRSTVSS